jgi:hypothetical protein
MSATIKPARKPGLGTTVHRDGTVSYWDVYSQSWRRIPLRTVDVAVLSTIGHDDRQRIKRAVKEMLLSLAVESACAEVHKLAAEIAAEDDAP